MAEEHPSPGLIGFGRQPEINRQYGLGETFFNLYALVFKIVGGGPTPFVGGVERFLAQLKLLLKRDRHRLVFFIHDDRVRHTLVVIAVDFRVVLEIFGLGFPDAGNRQPVLNYQVEVFRFLGCLPGE